MLTVNFQGKLVPMEVRRKQRIKYAETHETEQLPSSFLNFQMPQATQRGDY